MSIFRACTRSSLISKRTGLSISGQLSRYTSTEAAPIAEGKADGEIAVQPTRDVLVADVISGAPGVFSIIVLTLMLIIFQASFVIVVYVSTSPLATQCKVVQAKRNVGG